MKIGVNENVLVTKAALNDKQTLEITFKSVIAGAEELDYEELLNSGADDTEIEGDSLNFLMFMPSLVNSKDQTPEDPNRILKSFFNLKNQLTHILKAFYKEEEIVFSIFAGTGVTANSKASILENIGNAAVAEKMYSNLVNAFIEQVTPHIDDEENLFKLFLIRRSEAVHYGTLRKTNLKLNPFIEPMTVPVEKSRMWIKQAEDTTKFHEPRIHNTLPYVPRFDAWELGKKLDDTKISVPTKKNRDEGEEETTDAMFNGGGEGAAIPSFQVTEE